MVNVYYTKESIACIMRILTFEEMSGRLDRLFNKMAEIRHNKRKITDAVFVAMVSENLYLERLQISERCYWCVNNSLVCRVLPAASSWPRDSLAIVSLDNNS